MLDSPQAEAVIEEQPVQCRGQVDQRFLQLPQLTLALLLLSVFIANGCSFSTGGPAPDKLSNVGRQSVDSRKGEADELHSGIKRIEPFFQKMGKPQPADWLASRTEPGQTFEEYLAGDPVTPTEARKKLYIVALGNFGSAGKRVVDITAAYLAEFYDIPTESLSPQPLEVSYPNRRQNRLSGKKQIKTTYILDSVLTPILPADAAALIAFTQEDLYPNDSMNYVFGQASLEKRVGVWSLARLDDNADQQKFLSRTLKIAAHETGHMFSMRHCTKYECLMSGTNHLGETDRRPIDACPECTAKICWLSDAKMSDRYRRLADFCRRNNLVKDAESFSRKAAAVSGLKSRVGR